MILEGGFEKFQVSADDMWEKKTHDTRQVAKDMLGKSRGFIPKGK